MRLPIAPVFLGLLLALGGANLSTGLRARADTFAAAPIPQGVYYPRPETFPFTGTCAMEIWPDQAVIVGGASSSALKPTEAIDQLEKQLELMRTYLAEKHSELQLLERVRTLKTPQPGREDADPPFQVVQRLQVKLPADAPVDAILQKLIDLGFDRFGDNVLNNYNRREAVVRFRVSDLDAKLRDFQQICTVNAWKQWCAEPRFRANCESDTPPPELELESFTVHSAETLMRPDGNSAPWQFSLSRAQRSPAPPDLLGKLTVHLDGSIVLTYRPEEARP